MTTDVISRAHDFGPSRIARDQADKLAHGVLWKLTIASLFVPAFSPILAGPLRPALSLFFVLILIPYCPVTIPKKAPWLLGWGAWALLSYLVCQGRTTTMLSHVVFILSVFMFYSLVSRMSAQSVRKTCHLIVLIGVINALLAIVESNSLAFHEFLRQFNNSSFYTSPDRTINCVGGWMANTWGLRIRSTMVCAEPGFFSSIQALTVPFCLYLAPKELDKKLAYFGVTLLPIAASIWLSFGRTGWLAVVGGTAFFVILRLTRSLRAMMILALLVTSTILLFNLDAFVRTVTEYQSTFALSSDADHSIKTRLFSMTSGLEIAAEKPILGVGCGNVAEHEGASTSRGYMITPDGYGWSQSVLNMYINVAAETGLVGAAFLGVFLLSILFGLIQKGTRRSTIDRSMALMSYLYLLFIWLLLPDMRITFFSFVVGLALAASSPNRNSEIGKHDLFDGQ